MSRAQVPPAQRARRRPARFSSSKFAAPTPSRAHVSRPLLCERLEGPLAAGVRVVVGSPGSGKSSLLAEWLRGRPDGRTCWFNADAADRDPVRFWHGVIEAVRTVEPDFAEDAYDRLTLDDSVEPDALEALLASVEALDRRIVLVVDDFHLVSPTVHQDLRFLGRRGLGNVLLALGTRSEPSIGLDRLRLDGRLCELRDADLVLTPDEALELFDKLSPGVSADDVLLLQERTEGWVAGLQLAAVALQGSPAPETFVQRFAGTAQVITQYLSAEVLDAQPPEVLRFLTDTSVVDELTPGLAASLSPGTPVTLTDVEADHLLITRMDSAGATFRYHHLFADMLRYRLAATDPAHERVLHDRAASWFAAAGDLTSAFRHRWRAGDPGQAMGLIHGRVLSEYLAGHGVAVNEAGRSLRDADLVAAPGPAVSYCGALCLEGHPEAAAQIIGRVETLAGGRLEPAERMQLHATRAMIASTTCDTTATIVHGDAALELALVHDLTGDWPAAAASVVVRAHTWRGDLDAANEVVDAAPLASDDPVQAIETGSAIAFLRCEEGRLTEAEALASAALGAARLNGADRSTVDAAPRAVLGTVLLERGDVAEAEVELRAVSDLGPQVRAPMMILARLGLSRIWAANGNLEAALQILESARSLATRAIEVSAPASRVRAAECHLALALGELDQAAALAEEITPGFHRGLIEGRLDAALGRPHLARKVLDELEHEVTGTRQRLWLELTRLELAIAVGDDDIDDLAHGVLDLAEPQRFLFAIAEGGAEVLDAVCRVARRRPQSPYLDRLLLCRPHPALTDRALVQYQIDALSERERTVLRYLVTAMSYREIADDLFVSVNTVKTHVKNIIRKLHAESRVDAIARARALHYL